ncbi:hypothetical protein ATG66_3733 [Vibrio sp. ES.051]|uniref:DNA repair protein n=1 Tax=Vibrio sp. ES.051 TaxID=1761909 RepID=UPI000C0086C8|nr:DNA repair protein [Vibrio sp. ES.051]PFG45447.1 hypothetical protein ATG66_3733 [Vibrio sp. ES.051]
MSFFKSAYRWAASKCSAVKEKVSSAVQHIKKKSAKVWNAFTGKHYADEAEAIYAETKKRYDDAKQVYEVAVAGISASIEEKISQINAQKYDIYNVHFERFISISRRLHNVTVKGQPFEELFDNDILESQNQRGLRAKASIMEIDFNKMGMLDTLGMVLTLGIFTRKKAKASLANAKQERERINEDIAKLEAQQKQLSVINDSIDNVVVYFDKLIKSYSDLLERFEYGIQSQRLHQMSNSSDVFAHKLDFRLLPIVHLEEFRALFSLSIVLKQMANLGYLSDTGKLIENDSQKAKNIYEFTQAQSLCA